MGLFKHNKDKTNTTSTRDADTSQRSQMAPASTGVGLGGPGPATSGPAADHQLRDQNIGNTTANPNTGSTAPEANIAGRGAHHRLGDDRQIDPAVSGGAQGQQFDNDNARDRMGMGRNYTNGGHYPAEHQHHHHRQQNQNEAALGSSGAFASGSGVIGSGAIAEARLAKERELKAIDGQSQELAQAERLEQEAKIHRQRAVELGAHPDNKHLGGVVP